MDKAQNFEKSQKWGHFWPNQSRNEKYEKEAPTEPTCKKLGPRNQPNALGAYFCISQSYSIIQFGFSKICRLIGITPEP